MLASLPVMPVALKEDPIGPVEQRATPNQQPQPASEVRGLNTIQQSENQQLALHELQPAGTVQFDPLAKLPDWAYPQKPANKKLNAIIIFFIF